MQVRSATACLIVTIAMLVLGSPSREIFASKSRADSQPNPLRVPSATCINPVTQMKTPHSYVMRYPLQFLLLVAVATISAQTSIESFQREAEKALGRPISISETNELGVNNGETYCDLNPVLIKIRSELDANLRQQALAHELGHALICGRGILSVTKSIPSTDGALSIVVTGISSAIGSCYIDPLADAEAKKRGFSPAQLVTNSFENQQVTRRKNFRNISTNMETWPLILLLLQSIALT